VSTPTLVRGADLLGQGRADLLLHEGLITELGRLTPPARAQVVDAEGLIALPGLVDLHTHLREPGREDAETIATGSAAAAAGGFTAVFAMANTDPVADCAEVVERVYDIGRRVGLADVQPVGAVTRGLSGAELADLGLMATSRARVRVYSDDGRCVADARLMRRAMDYLKAYGGVISQHSQDVSLADGSACCHEGELSGRLGLPGWPGVAEEVIVARDVMLARHTGTRVHVAHVSTAGSIEVIRWAKAQGIQVTAEVTPHHLALTTAELSGYDPLYKVNPPLRPQEDVTALRAALADGTIDIVATDHAPHARHDKEHAFVVAAFGMLGLETALSVVSELMVTTGRLSWADIARVMSTAPARLGGLAAEHGRPLQVGEPANVTLVDPARVVTVDAGSSYSLSRNNPWHGRSFTGAVHATFLRGRPTYLDGSVHPLEELR
jgi:dihydroorotase